MGKISQKKAYKQIIFSLVLLTVFVVTTASILSYQFFDRFYTTKLAENNRRVMKYETQQFTATVLNRAQTLLSDLSVNSQYASALRPLCYGDIASPNLTLYRAYTAIRQVGNLYSPMVSSITIYYPTQELLLSSSMGYKVLTDKSNASYAYFAQTLPVFNAKTVAYWSLNVTYLPALANSPIAIGASARWSAAAENASIIVTLNESYLRDALNRMAAAGSDAFLISSDGTILSASSQSHSDILRESLSTVLALRDFESARIHSHILTVAALEGTPWRLVLASPTASYQAGSFQITRLVLVMVFMATVAGIVLALVLSRRLYSPISELMAVIHALPTSIGSSAHNEYATVRMAIHTLSLRLSDAERLLDSNRPLIHNITVNNLLKGLAAPDDLLDENLHFANVALPYACYCALLLEINGHVLMRMPSAEGQLLLLRLRDALENHAYAMGAKVYCCLGNRSSLSIIVNASNPLPACKDEISRLAAPLLQESTIGWALSGGNWYEGRDMLHRSWEEACAANGARFYLKPQEHVIQNSQAPHTPPPPALVRLEDRFAALLAQGQFSDALACVHQIAALWEDQPSNICARSLIKLNEAVLSHCKPCGMDMAFVERPQEALWNMREYFPLLRELLLAQPVTANAGSERSEQILQQTREFVNAHLDGDLSLEAIAAAMHFNPKYFSRLFKELSGMQLTDFINGQRIARAAELLSTTQLSIEAIAAMAGYNSPQYFSRRFKAAYGFTPGEYRSRGGKNPPETPHNG